MSKAFRILGILALVIAIVLGAGVIVLKKMFPPERIKAMITEQAAKHLHREVKIGAVDIGIFSGISISDFAISEAHTFKEGTFVSSEKFVLKFMLLPLLSKKVMIQEITLEKPRIQVIQFADGKTFNFSDLTSTAAAKPAAEEKKGTEEGAPIELTISKANIVDGIVTFTDRGPQKNKISLNPINLSVTATGLDKPMSVTASVKVDGVWTGKKINASLNTKSVVETPAERVDIESLTLKTDAAEVEAKGKVSAYSTVPQMDLNLTLKNVDFKKLSQWVSLPPELQISESPEASAHIKGTQDNLEAEVMMNLTPTSISYSDVFNKKPKTEFTIDLKTKVVKQNDVRLDRLMIKLAGIEANLAGDIAKATSPDPVLNLKLNVPVFDLNKVAEISNVAQPYSPSGKVGVDAAIRGTSKVPKLAGAVTLDNLGAKVDAYTVQNVNGKVNLTDDSAELPRLAGQIAAKDKAPADFKITASVKNFKAPDIYLDADFKTLDLGMFLNDSKGAEKGKPQPAPSGSGSKPGAKSPPPPEMKVTGKINIDKVVYTKFDGSNVKADWRLTGVTPTLEKLNGLVNVNVGQGKIHNIPLLAALAPVLRMDPSGGMVYTRMGGKFAIAQGTARTDDFQVNSPNADIYAKGSVNLPQSVPDMTITAKLPKDALGGTLGDFTNDADGRATFVFKLKGDWKPSLDTSMAQKRATEEIKKKATDLLQNEGKKLLEGIFK